ncbi:MAG: glucose-6-phosphate isomerase, partial [Pseudomonadota bacterium]
MTDTISAAWDRLSNLSHTPLADLFAGDADRTERMSQRIEFDIPEHGLNGMLLDWSKTHLDDAALEAFEALADACGFAGARD